MPRKPIVYGIVLTAVVGLTAFLFARNLDTRRGLPDAPESAQDYVCEKCAYLVQMTPRELDVAVSEWNRSGAALPAPEMGIRKMLILPCPACNELSLLHASRCPNCGNPFPRGTTDGVRHSVCKDCEKASTARPPGRPSAGN